jgi:hypothetical protein
VTAAIHVLPLVCEAKKEVDYRNTCGMPAKRTQVEQKLALGLNQAVKFGLRFLSKQCSDFVIGLQHLENRF